MANETTQGFKLKNDLPLDVRMVCEGEQQDWIDELTFFIGFGPIVFTNEIDDVNGTPIYYVSAGQAGQWTFKEIGAEIPSDVLRTENLGDTVAPIVGGELPVAYLPDAYGNGITRVGGLSVADANTILPGEAGGEWDGHSMANGDTWQVKDIPSGSVTFTKSDGAAQSYQFEVYNYDLITWSTADGKWNVTPFSNVAFMGQSFEVFLPVSGVQGGYTHGDQVLATDTIVSVIKKILQQREAFSYTNPSMSPNLDEAFGDRIYYAGNSTVDVGFVMDNFVINMSHLLGNYNELKSLTVSILYATGGGAVLGPSGESGEIINLVDTDDDQVPDNPTPAGMGFDINHIFPDPDLVRNGILDAPIPLNDAADYIRFRFVGIFGAATAKTDDLGADPNPPGDITRTTDIKIITARAIFANTYTGDLPSEAIFDLDATYTDAPYKAFMPTAGTNTITIPLAGKKSVMVAVPANVRLDYDSSITTGGDKMFRAPGASHQDVSIKLIDHASAASLGYRVYKIQNLVAYAADSDEVLTVSCIVDSTDPHWDAPIAQ